MAHSSYVAQSPQWLKGSQLLLEYKIKEPSIKTEKAPTLILLHGVGSNENDLFRLANEFPQDSYVISARAPFQFRANAFGWYEVDFTTGKPVYNKEQAEKSKLLIAQFINQLVEKYDLAKDKIYLVGFSQGAIMSYSVAISYPNKVKGIAALSGRMLEENQLILNQLERLETDVFISHSEKDNVLPYYHAEKAKSLLEGKTTRLKFETHSAGHSISTVTIKNLLEWFEI